MKQHKKIICKRILSFVMAFAMMLPFCAIMMPLIVSADESQNEETTLPTVSISWESGTPMSSDGTVAMPVKAAGESATSYKLTFTVKASGTVTAPITVRVQSFELSAISDVEYVSLDEEINLTQSAPEASRTVTVNVDTGYVTKLSATEIYTAEFGIAITEVTNAQKKVGGDTIRSQVLPSSKRVLEVMKNKDAISKNYGDGAATQDFKEGYVYKEMIAASANHRFTESVGVNSSSSSIYPQEVSPYAILESLAPKLFNVYNMRVYVNGRVNVTDDSSVSRGGFVFRLKGHDGKYDAADNYQPKTVLVEMDKDGKNWSNDKYYFSDSFKSAAASTAVAHRINDYGAYFTEVEDGEYISIYAQNKATGLTSGEKDFTIDLEFVAAETDALTIWDYRVSNRFDSKTGSERYVSRVYAGGDTLYLTLRFNKAVQFTHDGREPLKIQAEINGDNAYYFTYCGGDKTDTLIFSLTLPTDREVQGDEIKLIGFSNEGTKRIDDMLWHKGNRNNGWEIRDDSIKDRTIGCAVDTRTPSITIYDQSPIEREAKDASFKIKLDKFTDRGSLFVEWTHSATPPQAKADWSNLVPFSIGTEGYATVNVEKTELTGAYYAHVKAVSEAAVESVASYGPFYFDNTPPKIQNTRFSSGDGAQRYAISHRLLFDITDGDEVGGVSGVDEVYMKVQHEDGSNGLAGGVDNLTVYQSSKTSNRLTIQDGVASIDVEASMLDLAQDSYGAYRIAFYAIDKVKNESSPVWYTESLMFDTRKSFEARFEDAPDYSFEGRRIYKNGQTLIFSHSEEGTNEWELEFLRYNGVDVKEKLSANGFIGSVDASANNKYNLTLQASVQGYIEIGFLLNGEKHAVLGFYATDDEPIAKPTNYETLYAADRLLINEVWQLSTATYYSGNNRSGSYYVGDSTKPIFSSKEKALEYAKFFEKQDIVIEYIDDAEEQNNLERGVLAGYRRAEADKGKAVRIGQTWLRYKSISWTLGSGNEENWVYYFYSDEKETTIHPNLTPNLNAAIERNAKLICNYDGDNRLYLTLNNNAVTKDGEPSYKGQGIIKTQLSYTGIYSAKITCSADDSIYDSFIAINGQRMPIIGGYRFEIDAAQKGFVYYRQYNANAEWRPFANGESFRNQISSSGIYEICEFGNGYKTYLVYVDLDAPVISYELVVGEGTPQTGYVTSATTGATLRASQFTVKKLVNGVTGTLPVEADRWAYFYVLYSSIGGKEYTFMTMNELNRRGCTLETGVYKIYACDRFGNTMTQTVKINNEDVEITSKETSKGLMVTCNRAPTDIVLGTFKVERDGVLLDDVTYSQSMTFPKSGEYTISFEDVYGNVIHEVFAFDRPLPTVVFSREIQEGMGRYEQITVNATTSNALSTVVSENNREFMVSTSANIRISYPLSSGYKYEFIGTEPEFKASVLSSMQHIVIQSSSKRWTMLVYYEQDPDKVITITCNVDKDAPLITGTVFAPEYRYNDQNGAKDNVLFTSTGATAESEFYNGARAVGERVQIKWEDETGVFNVGYTFNGGKRVTLNSSLATWEPTEYGTYVIDATDLFGNKATFEFVFTDHIDFEVLFGNEAQQLDENPKNHITGNRYDSTLYTSREMKLVLKENALLAFYHTNGEKQFTYTLGFEAKKDEALLWVGLYGDTPDDVEDLQNIDLIQDVSGTLFEGDLTVKYSYENGVLTLTVPKCEKEYELWQFRVTDFTGHSPAIVQVERSSRTASFDLFKEGGEKIEISSEGFVGSNQKISLGNSSISEDTTEIVAYYSKAYTTDFKDAEAIVLYGKGAVGLLSEEGYYKIVATNKYGNEKVVYVVITFKLTLDIHVSYAELDRRTETLNVPGAYSVFTNRGVELVAWDTGASILCQKDGKAFEVAVTESDGYLSFTLSEIGEYTVTVKDGCGNDYTITVSIKEPETLTYNAFLAGFNENALKRDENYTNGALNLDKTKIEESGIHYIAFRKVGDEEWTVLYDLFSLDKIEYDKSVFEGTIGKNDGEYEVRFADKYGNMHTETVRVSRKSMLSIERQTQGSTKPSEYDFEFALENGAWSNYILTFINSSEKYLLKVDGEEVNFKDGKYTFTLPANLGAAEEYYVLEYVDDYGNSCTIKVCLYRFVPETSVAEGADTVTEGGTLYVKSDFSFVWGDYVSATYSMGNLVDVPFDMDTVFTEDGKYTLVFTDYAGNVSTRIIVKDSQVLYDMSNDGFIIYSGAILSSKVTLSPDEELTFTVTKNGEEYTEEGRIFTEDGHYVVTLTDLIGNVSKFEFTIYAKAKQSFTFVVPNGYSFSQIWLIADGGKTALVADVVLNEDGSQSYEFLADGRYEIELLHAESEQICYFTLNIDNTPPSALLVGAENGTVTRTNVSIEELVSGDMIHVYKNGELWKSFIVEGSSQTVLELLGNGDFGDYLIYIEDEAGNSVSYEFTKEFATNTYSNIFICLLLMAFGAIGIIYIRFNGKIRTK